MKELSVRVIFAKSSRRNYSYIKINMICLFFKDGVRSFDDFLREGLIEYLDVNEENNALVCSNLITSEDIFFLMILYLIDNDSQ